jgi:hypothetical protein
LAKEFMSVRGELLEKNKKVSKLTLVACCINWGKAGGAWLVFLLELK